MRRRQQRHSAGPGGRRDLQLCGRLHRCERHPTVRREAERRQSDGGFPAERTGRRLLCGAAGAAGAHERRDGGPGFQVVFRAAAVYVLMMEYNMITLLYITIKSVVIYFRTRIIKCCSALLAINVEPEMELREKWIASKRDS